MRKINWKLWAGRAISIVIALISGGAFFADGSTAVLNAQNEAGSVLDFLPVAGEGFLAIVGAIVPFFLHRFFPQLDDSAGTLPKEIAELVASALALASDFRNPKLQRRFFTDFLDVAVPIASSFVASEKIRATLKVLWQQVNEELGPGVTTVTPPPLPPAPSPPPATLADALRDAGMSVTPSPAA